MEDDQVNQDGDQGNQNQNVPGWISGLPDDLKSDQTFTQYKTVGDFAKSHIETVVKAKELEGKLAAAIFKPDDKATPEQREAYYRSLGKPEKATEYEFPKTEGAEHDPKMIEWAQSAFYAAHLSKEQAAAISTAWDGFITGMAKANEEAAQKAIADTEAKMKAELGDQYDVAKEVTRRLLTKHVKPEEMAFLDEGGIGNHPALIRLIFELAKKTGEDVSVSGAQHKGETPKVGMNYTSMDQFKGG